MTIWTNTDRGTVTGILRQGAEKWPDRTFLGDGPLKLSYAEVERETNRLAHGLKALGVNQGDTVCTLLDTGMDAVLIWFAINKLGAIAAPVNTSYKGEFLRHQVHDCGAALLIAEAVYADNIAAIADRLPNIARVLYRGDLPTEPGPFPAGRFETLRSADDRPVGVPVEPGDLTMLIYTSGTTGPSKGCMISHAYACQHARVMIGAHGLRDGDIAWMPLPLFHLVGTCGITLAGMMVGATIELYPRFSVSNFWPEIERTGANFVNLIGSMLPLIANAPDCDAAKRCHGQLRVVAGGPWSKHLQELWRTRFGVKIAGMPGYGLTEMSIVLRHVLGTPQPDGTSGKRFEDYDVRIFDDAGNECPPGVVGEVVMRPLKPGAMFDGYWNRPADTLKVFQELWFRSGDLGFFDEDGFFHFVDRKKDYLRKGGENISSMEMEAVFTKHPDIKDVAVHAVPSELLEDEIKITVVAKAGAAEDARALCLWAIERLPAFAVPRYIEFRATLPVTPTGKVMKVELRKDGVTEATWDREASDLAPRRRARAS